MRTLLRRAAVRVLLGVAVVAAFLSGQVAARAFLPDLIEYHRGWHLEPVEEEEP